MNEYVFDCIEKASNEDKNKLSAKHLRSIKTPKSVYRFVNESSLDEKMMVLSKLGYSFEMVLKPSKLYGGKELKTMVKKYKDDERLSALDSTINLEIFATDDKYAIRFLNLLANTCHSESYFLNRNYHKIAKRLNAINGISKNENDNIEETEMYVAAINKFTLSALLHMKEFKGKTQVGDLDFLILLFLFHHQNKYVKRETIFRQFEGYYRPILVTTALKRVTNTFHAERYINGAHVEYLITSLGIDAVMQFHAKNAKDTLEY